MTQTLGSTKGHIKSSKKISIMGSFSQLYSKWPPRLEFSWILIFRTPPSTHRMLPVINLMQWICKDTRMTKIRVLLMCKKGWRLFGVFITKSEQFQFITVVLLLLTLSMYLSAGHKVVLSKKRGNQLWPF